MHSFTLLSAVTNTRYIASICLLAVRDTAEPTAPKLQFSPLPLNGVLIQVWIQGMKWLASSYIHITLPERKMLCKRTKIITDLLQKTALPQAHQDSPILTQSQKYSFRTARQQHTGLQACTALAGSENGRFFELINWKANYLYEGNVPFL